MSGWNISTIMRNSYPMAYRKDCLNGPLIMEKIYELTKGEAIISTDVGQHQMWAAQHYKYKKAKNAAYIRRSWYNGLRTWCGNWSQGRLQG